MTARPVGVPPLTCPDWCTSTDLRHEVDWDFPDVACDMHAADFYSDDDGGRVRAFVAQSWPKATPPSEAGVSFEFREHVVYSPEKAREIAQRIIDAVDQLEMTLRNVRWWEQ